MIDQNRIEQLNEYIKEHRVSDKSEELKLEMTDKGLALIGDDQLMIGDFDKMKKRLKQANLQGEMLVKAARIKGHEGVINLIDATAGMGEDSLLLAAAGMNVHLYERDPVIAALLADTLRRSADDPELTDTVSRMHLHAEDSMEAMKNFAEEPDVILLDPMFPERKKSALIKKKFQLLQQLEQPCADEEELFMAAISAKPKKIVIKRPLKGPYLAGKKPDYSLKGKAIRYDCLVNIR